MDRRTFMKLLGGLASMPIIGRIAKPLKSETVQEGIAAVGNKSMELYEMVIAKVMKEGKKIGESGRVDSYKHPDRPDITVDVNQTDGSAEIYFDTDRGSKGFAEIKKDPETGGSELTEAEEVYRFYGPEGDYVKDIDEGEIIGGIENLEEFTRIKKAKGGVASIQDYADAVSKVSAGTTAQKLQNIGRYATNKLGITQKHFDTIAAMKSDPKKFGIDKQIDYAKLSGKDLVKGANPALQPFAALGQGLASPIYDYYQALQKYSDKGYQGDFELSKKGIVDFGKNLLRVGEEFAAQKPIQMAAGRTLGGLEAIQEGLSQFGTAAAADTSKLKPLSDKERFRLGLFAANQVDEKTGDRLYDIDKMYDNYTKNFAASGGKGYFSSPDMLSRFKQFYADGGSVDLTIITMPDISGSGVESLFKRR